ncbi:hypothetical protein [Streptomyces sp. NPDC055912]|uniref:hypothetical protein n=1 Tax=Streptomyces sp. NPDC055912 TaxID=3345660 RepID=UPI0035D62E9F
MQTHSPHGSAARNLRAAERPVEVLRAGAHAVRAAGSTIVGAAGPSSTTTMTTTRLYECRECRQRAPRESFAELRCTQEIESARALVLAQELVPAAFGQWERLGAPPAEGAPIGRSAAVELVASELTGGASHAWEEEGLVLRRESTAIVLAPYKSPAERAAEAAARAAEDAHWDQELADTEFVPFEDLAVGDVVVRGYGDGRRAVVLGEPAEFADRFGRSMRRLWCRSLESGAEGWVEYGPGGQTLRVRR